jgi:hypothetical protein
MTGAKSSGTPTASASGCDLQIVDRTQLQALPCAGQAKTAIHTSNPTPNDLTRIQTPALRPNLAQIND